MGKAKRESVWKGGIYFSKECPFSCYILPFHIWKMIKMQLQKLKYIIDENIKLNT
jgi:hypothetical protein